MPVQAEFVEILADAPVALGDANRLWEAEFSTTGRVTNGAAFLMFNVKHLNFASSPVPVKVNQVLIGYIYPYRELNDDDRNNAAEHWHTQLIAIGGSTLHNGANELEIQAATFPNPGNPGNLFDDYSLKNVICFYHKES